MQAFIDRCSEQGAQRGLQIGEQRGKQLGSAAVLLRQIERRFGPPDEPPRTRIAAADADTLLHWSERILDAKTLDEVLR